jgi:rubrerythrin
MNNGKKGFDALEGAIKFEEIGRTFFIEASEITEEKFGKSIFRSLADAELDHIERIKEIYGSLSKTGEWPDAPALFSPKRMTKTIFDEALAEIDRNVKTTTGELDAAKLGIQYEERGLRMYQDLSDEAFHPLEQKFYTQLGYEERGHMLILKDIEAYYTDPVRWFSEKEKLHWDGA